MRFWLRVIELTIGDKKYFKDHTGGMEVRFNVKESTNEDKDNANINLSTVSIYNLNETSRNNIKKGQNVILNAGYEGHVGNLLVGRVDSVKHERQGLDICTEIKVTDGGKEWRQSKLNRTYQKDTKASYIMRDIANVMGYDIAQIKPKKDIVYKLGKSISGRCSTTLNQLVRDTDSKLYIKGNRLTISPKSVGIPNGFLLNANHGLLTTPQVREEEHNGKKKVFYDIDCKLNHELALDSYITVESLSVNGNFRIVEVEHDDSFTTRIKVVKA